MAFLKTISLDNRNIADTTVIITPSENIELNPLGGLVTINGNLVVQNTLDVFDSAHFHEQVTIDGSTILNGTLDVFDSAHFHEQVTIDGSTILNGTLDVFDSAHLHKNLTVDNDTVLNSTLDVFDSAHFHEQVTIDGSTILNSTLDVFDSAHFHEQVTIDGSTILNGTLDVFDNTRLHKNLRVDSDTVLNGTLSVEGNTHLHKNLTVDSDTVLNGTLNVFDSATVHSNLRVALNHQVDGTLNVNGNATFNSEVYANRLSALGDNNFIDLDYDEAVDRSNSILLSSLQSVHILLDHNNSENNNYFAIYNDISKNELQSSNAIFRVDDTGNLYIGGDLEVKGDTHLRKSLTVDSDVTVYGSLYVHGTQTIVNSQTVTINDKNIVVADSAANYFEADGAGITVGGSLFDSAELLKPHIIYSSNEDQWETNKPLEVVNVTVLDSSGINTTNIVATESITQAVTYIDSTGISSNNITLSKTFTLDSTYIDSTGITSDNLTLSETFTLDDTVINSDGITSDNLTLSQTFTLDDTVINSSGIVSDNLVLSETFTLDSTYIDSTGITSDNLVLSETFTLDSTYIDSTGITSDNLTLSETFTLDDTIINSDGITSDNLTLSETFTLDSTYIDSIGITSRRLKIFGVVIDSNGLQVAAGGALNLGENVTVDDGGLTVETVAIGDSGAVSVDSSGFHIKDSGGVVIKELDDEGLFFRDSNGILTNSITDDGYFGNYINFDSDWDSSLSSSLDSYQDIRFDKDDRKLVLNLMRLGRYAQTAEDLNAVENNYQNDFNEIYDPGAEQFEQYDSLNRIIYFTVNDNHPGIAYYKNSPTDPDPFLIDNTYNSEFFGGDSEYQQGRFYHNPYLRKTWYMDKYLPQPKLISYVLDTTNDLREGDRNLYYTQDRFDSAFQAALPKFNYEISANIILQGFDFDSAQGLQLGFNTDSIPEGLVNRYFTEARVVNAIDSHISVASNPPSGNGGVTYNNGVISYTPPESSIFYDDLSVTVGTPSGSGLLSYDGTNGEFTFNPADLSAAAIGYLTVESDPVFLAHPAHNITSNDISNLAFVENIADKPFIESVTDSDAQNWNEAYSWGDHSLAGYLTTSSISGLTKDSTFDARVDSNVSLWALNNLAADILNATDSDAQNWNEAYSWGDHSLAGYLSAVSINTEIDSWMTDNISNNIRFSTDSDVINWNEAYSWGDHSTFHYYQSSDYNTDWDSNFNSQFQQVFDSAFNKAVDSDFPIRFDSAFDKVFEPAFDSSFNVFFDSAFDNSFDNKTTDDLAEGTNNRYLTQPGFNAYFNLKTTDDLAETDDNKYYKKIRFDSDFSRKSTNDLDEGGRLYYTRARFDSDFLDAFGGTFNRVIDSDFPIRFDSTFDKVFEPAFDSSFNVFFDSAFDNAFSQKTTDDLEEGADNRYLTQTGFNAYFNLKTTDNLAETDDNKYYTSARFDSDFSRKSTNDLDEGGRLYYTRARFDSAFLDAFSGTLVLSLGDIFSQDSPSAPRRLNLTQAAINALDSASLSSLGDVNSSMNPVDGQVLAWDNTAQYWTTSTLSAQYDDDDVEALLDGNLDFNIVPLTDKGAGLGEANKRFSAIHTADLFVNSQTIKFTDPNSPTTTLATISFSGDGGGFQFQDGAGNPTTLDDSSIPTSIARTSYVDTQISNLINGAGPAFDTLSELATALESGDAELLDAINAIQGFSGDYNDLNNKPSLFDGAYSSLSGLPTIPSTLTDLGITDGTNNQILKTDGNGNFSFTNAAEGFSGDYNDLNNKPTIPQEPAINRNSGSPTLASGVTGSEIRSLIGAGTSSISSSSTVTWSSTQTFSSKAKLQDNVHLEFGTGEDVEMYFTGSQFNTDINSGYDWYIRDGNNSNVNRFKFDIDNGEFTTTGNITAFQSSISSDKNLKTNIAKIEKPLEKINQLNGVQFEWKKDGNKSAGVIAQDVEKVLPEAVTNQKDINTADEYKTVNYDALHSIYIEAIKELTLKVESLEAQLKLRG